jgi:aromatic amino acid transport protein AroP
MRVSVYLIPVWLGALAVGYWMRQRREAVVA